jgi:hypothetical protein
MVYYRPSMANGLAIVGSGTLKIKTEKARITVCGAVNLAERMPITEDRKSYHRHVT